MDTISLITNKVNELTEGSALFLIEVKVKPTNNFKVFLDGDNGINIEACTKINRALYKAIEEAAIYPEGDFSLEVSSPGVDEPLRNLRQYHKNVGRTVEVVMQDETKHYGVLAAVSEAEITIETIVGKKKEVASVQVPMDQIKKTVVQIVF